MRDFYLVQRGTFAKTMPVDACLTGCKGVVSLDCMGDVRFELCAVPKAFRRIMWDYQQYVVIATGISTPDGKVLKLFCRLDKSYKTISAIREFVDKKTNWMIPKPSEMDLAVSGVHVPTNFWWCIDPPREDNLSDWMVFYAEDEAKFKKAIANDYYNWWMKMSEEEREEEYKKSLVW